MTPRRTTIAALATLGLVALHATDVLAQTPPADQDHTVHHPGADGAAQPAPAPAPSGAAPGAAMPGMPGGGMMPGMAGGGMMPNMMPGMMGGMMGGGPGQAMPMMPMMMQMMQMMHGMGPGGGAMMGGPMGGRDALPALGRVEGRLAFLRTELAITEAQAGPWGAFADAVRSATAKLREAMAAVPPAAAQPVPAPQQMQRRIAMLTAQLEANRAIAAALGPLYAALAEPQRRSADELLGAHPLGMRMRGF